MLGGREKSNPRNRRCGSNAGIVEHDAGGLGYSRSSPDSGPALAGARHGRGGPTTDMNRLERLWSRGIFVYPPVLHDNLEVLRGVGDQVNILQRVALDQQQIGERALFHDAELPWIGIPLARQCK